MRRIATLTVALTLVAACGAGADRDATDTTLQPAATETTAVSDTAQPESTTLPATTVPAPAESTSTTIPAGTGTTGAPSFTVGSPTVTPPDPLPGSGGASGSGCEPGPGPLPDGVWFGEASATQTASVTFDLVCFFFLDHAYQAAADDGIDPDTVTNDLYIRNRNPETREVPVDGDAVGWELVGFAFEPVPWDDWPHPDLSPWHSGVWLYINDGVVTELVEQFTP